MRAESPGDIAAIHAVHLGAFPTDGEARLVDALRQGGHATISLIATEENEVAGHGAGLVQAGIEACRLGGYAYVVVLGHPDYYGRFGFRRARDAGLENEYGADEEFMVLELRPDALRGVRGLVKYSPEFSVL